MGRADTLRWRGVMGERQDGMSVADLRAWLADADALAAREGVSAGDAKPELALNKDATIRRIWVGVARRRWREHAR